MEFQLICPLGSGQQIDARWIKSMNGKCWRRTVKGPSQWADCCQIILVCTFFPISVSKRQKLHASKYLHDDAVMEERLIISLWPNPHTYSPSKTGFNFQCFIKLKPFLCLYFSSWRILSVACAHCIALFVFHLILICFDPVK